MILTSQDLSGSLSQIPMEIPNNLVRFDVHDPTYLTPKRELALNKSSPYSPGSETRAYKYWHDTGWVIYLWLSEWFTPVTLQSTVYRALDDVLSSPPPPSVPRSSSTSNGTEQPGKSQCRKNSISADLESSKFFSFLFTLNHSCFVNRLGNSRFFYSPHSSFGLSDCFL